MIDPVTNATKNNPAGEGPPQVLKCNFLISLSVHCVCLSLDRGARHKKYIYRRLCTLSLSMSIYLPSAEQRQQAQREREGDAIISQRIQTGVTCSSSCFPPRRASPTTDSLLLCQSSYTHTITHPPTLHTKRQAKTPTRHAPSQPA